MNRREELLKIVNESNSIAILPLIDRMIFLETKLEELEKLPMIRINAENPGKNFRPSPGTISDMYLPGGKGIRIDSAIYSGYTIPPYYDSMVAKLIVWAKNRQEAIRKMQSALGEVIIEGIDTNVDYQYGIVNHPDYIEGNIDIEFIERL